MTVIITFAAPTVRSRLAEMMLFNRLPPIDADDELRAYLVGMFVPLMTRGTITGELGFTLPSINADVAQLEAGLEAFGNAPGELYDALVLALNNADAVPGDPDVQPGEKKA